jgi:hypothetical protein
MWHFAAEILSNRIGNGNAPVQGKFKGGALYLSEVVRNRLAPRRKRCIKISSCLGCPANSTFLNQKTVAGGGLNFFAKEEMLTQENSKTSVVAAAFTEKLRVVALGLASLVGGKSAEAQKPIAPDAPRATPWRVTNETLPSFDPKKFDFGFKMPETPEVTALRAHVEIQESMRRIDALGARIGRGDFSTFFSPTAPLPRLFSRGDGGYSSALLSPPWSTAEVFYCKRPTDITFIEFTRKFQESFLGPGSGVDLTHHWLRTPTTEAGLGAEGGEVPGRRDSIDDGLDLARHGFRAQVNDHSGESERVGAVCTPVPNVDVDCVNEALTIGRPAGRWIPPFSDCQTFARSVVQQCAVPTPAAQPTSAPLPATSVEQR